MTAFHSVLHVDLNVLSTDDSDLFLCVCVSVLVQIFIRCEFVKVCTSCGWCCCCCCCFFSSTPSRYRCTTAPLRWCRGVAGARADCPSYYQDFLLLLLPPLRSAVWYPLDFGDLRRTYVYRLLLQIGTFVWVIGHLFQCRADLGNGEEKNIKKK